MYDLRHRGRAVAGAGSRKDHRLPEEFFEGGCVGDCRCGGGHRFGGRTEPARHKPRALGGSGAFGSRAGAGRASQPWTASFAAFAAPFKIEASPARASAASPEAEAVAFTASATSVAEARAWTKSRDWGA